MLCSFASLDWRALGVFVAPSAGEAARRFAGYNIHISFAVENNKIREIMYHRGGMLRGVKTNAPCAVESLMTRTCPSALQILGGQLEMTTLKKNTSGGHQNSVSDFHLLSLRHILRCLSI